MAVVLNDRRDDFHRDKHGRAIDRNFYAGVDREPDTSVGAARLPLDLPCICGFRDGAAISWKHI